MKASIGINNESPVDFVIPKGVTYFDLSGCTTLCTITIPEWVEVSSLLIGTMNTMLNVLKSEKYEFETRDY